MFVFYNEKVITSRQTSSSTTNSTVSIATWWWQMSQAMADRTVTVTTKGRWHQTLVVDSTISVSTCWNQTSWGTANSTISAATWSWQYWQHCQFCPPIKALWQCCQWCHLEKHSSSGTSTGLPVLPPSGNRHRQVLLSAVSMSPPGEGRHHEVLLTVPLVLPHGGDRRQDPLLFWPVAAVHASSASPLPFLHSHSDSTLSTSWHADTTWWWVRGSATSDSRIWSPFSPTSIGQ